MKLPKIDKPLFELTIPSLDKKVLCRPFVVKEEKILLMAQQSQESKDIIIAIKQILENCIQDATFSSDSLATFDLEYMFLKLRSRSVNNIIKLSYQDSEDDEVYDFEIDLEKVEMLQENKFDKKIMITDTVGLVMKYPSITIIDKMDENMTQVQTVEYLIKSCIDTIFDEDNVYPVSDSSDEELSEFIDSLDVESFNKIQEFFESIPKMYYKIEYENKMGTKRVIELSSLTDFFTFL